MVEADEGKYGDLVSSCCRHQYQDESCVMFFSSFKGKCQKRFLFFFTKDLRAGSSLPWNNTAPYIYSSQPKHGLTAAARHLLHHIRKLD